MALLLFGGFMWTGEDGPSRCAEEPAARRFREEETEQRDDDREGSEETDVDDTLLEEEGYGYGV
jgi:hypothetical protein